MILRELDYRERPREKALQYGIETLNNSELLALVLRTGSKQESVIELAQHVINKAGGFDNLADITISELTSIKGIKKAKAIELLAALEIAKRIKATKKNNPMIKEPRDGYNFIKDKLMFEKQEKVILLCLNNRLEVIREKTMFVGTSDMSIISGKEIFKEAIMCNSSRIVVVHNHPSGNVTPSKEDEIATRRLMEMAEKLEVEVVDHLIVGKNGFYSFASKRLFAD